MKGDYPRFNATYTHDELVEHFLLTPTEHAGVIFSPPHKGILIGDSDWKLLIQQEVT